MRTEPTGVFVDGREMEAVTIHGGGLTARVVTFGASLARLTVATPAGPREVLLGFDRDEDLVAQRAYINCIAGRCANRIRDGRFTLDGTAYQLATDDGPHHLHGGMVGFGRRLWTVESADDRSVTLAIVSEDGEEGYPGRVEARSRYAVSDDRRLTIELTAITDAPTLVNLAAHGYFALDDEPTVLGHRMRIAADRYTPAGPDVVPTGEIAPVEGTVFDFRAERVIRNAADDDGHQPYDTNFVLADAPSAKPRFAARVTSPVTGLALEVWTTEPGLQVYDGGFLPVPQPLRGGRPGLRFGGLCLEPQRFPDAINHPHFAGAVLRPGETYAQTTEYRFGS